MFGIKHIFFDLDDTLWDFEANSRETLQRLYQQFRLDRLGIKSFSVFLDVYRPVNEQYWMAYRNGSVDKQTLRSERFYKTLLSFGIDNSDLAGSLGEAYLQLCPRQMQLVPHTREVLEYLSKKYRLHIITNGFKETQFTKLETTGLLPFFQTVITSELTGCQKPDPRIFSFAHRLSGAEEKHHCLMVGDNLEADIQGASGYGFHVVYFNRKKLPQGGNCPSFVQIGCLRELMKIL